MTNKKCFEIFKFSFWTGQKFKIWTLGGGWKRLVCEIIAPPPDYYDTRSRDMDPWAHLRARDPNHKDTRWCMGAPGILAGLAGQAWLDS